MDTRWKTLAELAFNFPIPVFVQGGTITVVYPRMLRQVINEKGFFRPEKLGKFLETSHFISSALLPPMHGLAYTDPSKTAILISMGVELTPRAYHRILKRRLPYKIRSKVLNAGVTSFVIEHVMSGVEDDVPLVTWYMSLVYVDWTTRRPAPLPASFRDSVANRKTWKPNNLKLPKCPRETFDYQVEAQPSDLDTNLHVNQSVYIRICSDTACAASAGSFYNGIPHVSSLPLLKMSILFIKESQEGDLLTCSTWQDRDNIYKLHFIISKNNAPVIYSMWILSPFVPVLRSSL